MSGELLENFGSLLRCIFKAYVTPNKEFEVINAMKFFSKNSY